MARQLDRPVAALGRVGDHTMFYGRAIAGMPFAATH
jgi:phospholipid/cholesterol/gamma-HCH transport system permease protein